MCDFITVIQIIVMLTNVINRLSVSFFKFNTKRIRLTENRGAHTLKKKRKWLQMISICVWKMQMKWLKFRSTMNNKQTNKQNDDFFFIWWLSCGVRLLINVKKDLGARVCVCVLFFNSIYMPCFSHIFGLVLIASRHELFHTFSHFDGIWSLPVQLLMTAFWNAFNPFFWVEFIHRIWICFENWKHAHSFWFFFLNGIDLFCPNYEVVGHERLLFASMASLATYLNEYRMHSRFKFFRRSFHEF